MPQNMIHNQSLLENDAMKMQGIMISDPPITINWGLNLLARYPPSHMKPVVVKIVMGKTTNVLDTSRPGWNYHRYEHT